MLRRSYLLLVWMCCAVVGFAQGTDSIVPPHGTVALRSFDEDRIKELKADPALDYDRDLRQLPSLWERIKAWLWDRLDDILGTRAAGFISQNLLYVLVFVILVFAVFILSKGGLRRVFHGAPRSLAEVATVSEDIREMDLNALIAEAERNGDLRRAIRLHYLLVLRKLVDQDILHWSPDHTDRDYMAQIRDPALRARFTQVALVFQWVWYGHAEVDQVRYDGLRRPFVEFETVPVA
ncbi:MAG TPA: DUF4129 domain-containing protein [Flavobacteriales bacterium]|nr:DUF4129 domain-containing protein [Flavobacteriales bacterium]